MKCTEDVIEFSGLRTSKSPARDLVLRFGIQRAVRMCQIVPPRAGIYAVTKSGYGKAVCRVLDVPVPLETLNDTEVTVCKSV